MKRPSAAPKSGNRNRTRKPQAKRAAAGLPGWVTAPHTAAIGVLVAVSCIALTVIGWDTVAAPFRGSDAGAPTQCLQFGNHKANLDGAQDLGDHESTFARVRNGMQHADATIKDAVDRCRIDACPSEARTRYIKSVKSYVGEFSRAMTVMDRWGKSGIYLVHDLYREGGWSSVGGDVRSRIEKQQFTLAEWRGDQADIVLLLTKRPDEVLPCGY